MKISTREVDGVTIMDIAGKITLGEETGALRKAVRDLLEKGKNKIVVNLAEVHYIDSSGVGELVGSFTATRNQGGDLKLANLTKRVHDLLQITKLVTIFDIKDDEITAAKSFDWFFAK
jgi:anti-sigma B factor antagonist